jgi:CheY-like chemotaxis protein
MKKQVLVIEDDEAIRDVVLMFLEWEGYEVITAEDGIDGFKKLEDIIPDLILLDLLMPRMDGYEFIKLLRRRQGKLTSIPVIAFTANTQAHTDIDQIEFTDLIPKPFHLEDLLKKISTFCDIPHAVHVLQ